MISVVLMDLPTTVRGFVRENPDGSYTIVINARMSIDMQRVALQHELRHIQRGDLDSLDDIDQIEMEMRHVDRENLNREIQV